MLSVKQKWKDSDLLVTVLLQYDYVHSNLTLGHSVTRSIIE